MNIQPVPSTEEEWRKRLTPDEYRVLREQGTEAPFSGRYWREDARGRYRCAGCGAPLFSSETKLPDAGPASGDSLAGWPAFSALAAEGAVTLHEDTTYGMRRTEVRCARCGSHLGHVFDDAKAPGGKHYCINSVCLNLELHEEGDGKR